jgi:hypothetical protein
MCWFIGVKDGPNELKYKMEDAKVKRVLVHERYLPWFNDAIESEKITADVVVLREQSTPSTKTALDYDASSFIFYVWFMPTDCV